jgi:hypothetical protein
MPAPDSPAPESLPRRRPICTIASWVAPAIGGLLTFVVYQNAVVRRQNGEWLPGLGQLIVGTILTAFVAFAFGLAALLRREQNRWLALLPFLSGLGIVLYFSWNVLQHWLGSY